MKKKKSISVKQTCIILRTAHSPTRDLLGGGIRAFGVMDAPHTSVAVEVAEVTKRQIASLSNESNVAAIAPPLRTAQARG